VWRELERVFRPGQRLLELNCGTGIDAVHLASQGMRVLACDISPGMIHRASQLVSDTETGDRVDLRVLPTEKISALGSEEAFDGAFSNFSGLNCVHDLSTVARDLAQLLKPGASVLVCMIGRFVPWDLAWFLAHGSPARAVHRFRSKRSCREADILTIHRPSVKEIASTFVPWFRLRRWKGIGIAVPPSYMESWARRFPKATNVLARVDARIGNLALFRNMADQVLLEFETRNTQAFESRGKQ
jgi:SAM-dependent methyltransferase